SRNFDALMCKPETVRNAAHLHGDRMVVEPTLPGQVAGLPRRLQPMRRAGLAIGLDERHHDAVAVALDLERDLRAIEPHGAATLAGDLAAVHLPGNLPLALAIDVVDCGGDRG